MERWNGVGRAPKTLFSKKPVHLLSAEIADEVRVGDLGKSAQISGREAAQESQPGKPIGFLESALEAFEQHEKRMVSGNVVGAAIFGPILPGAIGGTGGLELDEAQVMKRAGFPSEHVGFHLVEGVPTGSAKEAADGVPRSAAIDFGCAADMERRVAR